ncbi:MAG: hypothetical protein WB783_20070 [Arenicellales bacterium]
MSVSQLLGYWRRASDTLGIAMEIMDPDAGFIQLRREGRTLDVLLAPPGDPGKLKLGCNGLLACYLLRSRSRTMEVLARTNPASGEPLEYRLGRPGDGTLKGLAELIRDRTPILVRSRDIRLVRVIDAANRRYILAELLGAGAGVVRLEDFYPETWRLLVVNGHIAAALARTGIRVVGDGKTTIAELAGDYLSTRWNKERGDSRGRPEVISQLTDRLSAGGSGVPVPGRGCPIEVDGPFPFTALGRDALQQARSDDGLTTACRRVASGLGLGAMLATAERSRDGHWRISDAGAAESLAEFAVEAGAPESVIVQVLRTFFGTDPEAIAMTPECPASGGDIEGESAREFESAAASLGLATRTLDRSRMVMRIQGNGRRLDLRVTKYPAVSCNGAAAASFTAAKHLCHRLFRRHGIPAPEYRAFDCPGRESSEALEQRVLDYAADRFPVVVKPSSASVSIGVTVNIRSETDLRHAVRRACRSRSPAILVEEYITPCDQPVPGTDYRVNTCRGIIVGLGFRTPLHIIGDGVRTCARLIEDENAARSASNLMLIGTWPGSATGQMLEKAGLGLDDIPEGGRFINLFQPYLFGRPTGLMEAERFHPDNLEMFRAAARLTGLEWLGFDFIIEDPARSYREVRSAITDVNSRPVIPPAYSRFYALPLLRAYFFGTGPGT